jgi:hypothetical protein
MVESDVRSSHHFHKQYDTLDHRKEGGCRVTDILYFCSATDDDWPGLRQASLKRFLLDWVGDLRNVVVTITMWNGVNAKKPAMNGHLQSILDGGAAFTEFMNNRQSAIDILSLGMKGQSRASRRIEVGGQEQPAVDAGRPREGEAKEVEVKRGGEEQERIQTELRVATEKPRLEKEEPRVAEGERVEKVQVRLGEREPSELQSEDCGMEDFILSL